MKVAIPITGNTLDSDVDEHFGRCKQFAIVETDNMKVEVVENTGLHGSGGAGISAAELIGNRDVEVVLAGNIGPNAVRTLGSAGVRFVTGVTGSARSAVEALAQGKLQPTPDPTVGRFHGMAGGGRGHHRAGNGS